MHLLPNPAVSKLSLLLAYGDDVAVPNFGVKRRPRRAGACSVRWMSLDYDHGTSVEDWSTTDDWIDYWLKNRL